MNHAFLKTAIAAFVTCAAVSVSAANPFTDVSTDDWAYQAIAQLSSQNVVDGYPDGTFRGEKNVTRFELAQIVGKLMAKKDSLTAEQQATVAKLSASYADELKDLGVRVAELEKKRGKIDLITELRVQSVDRYDNIFKDSKKKTNELTARIRLNTIARVNDRSTVYGQMETYLDMNGKGFYDIDKFDSSKESFGTSEPETRDGYHDGELHLNRLWATYQFGKKQDSSDQPFGPSKNLIGIGMFPVKMGVTGYTYDDQVKGAFISFGDYQRGGRFTLAYGQAAGIKYEYTGPMMHGVTGLNKIVKDKLVDSLNKSDALKQAIAADTTGKLKEIMENSLVNINKSTNLIELSQSMEDAKSDLNNLANNESITNPQLKALYAKVAATVSAGFDEKNPQNMLGSMYYNGSTDTLYPMGKDVVMGYGVEEDVPVAYASYIYKVPDQWEFHAYGMKACGPVGHIAKAYGFAGSVQLTPMLRLQGEFVKNLRKLPLNNERPYSYNFGLHYGNANVLKAKTFSIGMDYVYSQAGTYFGGSSDAIVDQYTGHVYKNWNGQRMPAYFADKIDAELNGTAEGKKFGGAKFCLAKAAYVPMRGLIVEAEYGFNAKDMGGKKMDNMLLLKATAYIK